MLRTSKRKRPVKNRRRTSQASHDIVGIFAQQLAVIRRRGRRTHLSHSLVSDIHGTVRTLKKEFSEARSIYPKDSPPTVVRIYGTPESLSELADDNERSALTTPDYVVGSWSSFPTGDAIPHSDAEEMDFHPRMGISNTSDFAEDEFTYTYSGRKLDQGPGEVAQMTPTPRPVYHQQEYGFRAESQVELGNESRHYDSHDLVSSASIPSEWGGLQDLSPVVEQLAAGGWARPSDQVPTSERRTVLSRPSPVSEPFTVITDRLLLGGPRHSVSDLSVDPEVNLGLRPTWDDSGWSMAPAKLSEGRIQHQLARQFVLGIDGETPMPSVVNMVERIARAVEAKTTGYVYSVDEDGAFSFDAWLASGLFIMCEVDLYGEINAGLYRSPTGPQESFLPRMTEDELLDNL